MLSHSGVLAFLAQRGQLLLDPTHLPGVRDCTPLPIYAPNSVKVFTSRRCNVKRLHSVARAFRDRGVTAVRPNLLLATMPDADRIVARVRFGHMGRLHAPGTFSDLTYFLRANEDGVRLCMLEIVDCPAYETAAERQFQLHA